MCECKIKYEQQHKIVVVLWGNKKIMMDFRQVNERKTEGME